MSASWNGNSQVFRTYVKGKSSGDGKAPVSKIKGINKILSFEEAEKHQCFGGVLNAGFIDISFDTDDLSQKFWDMAEVNNWNCLILENEKNNHIHSFWKNTQGKIKKSGADVKLAVGLIADIHQGDTYIPLRVHGIDRFPPSFEPDDIDEVPDELLPVKTDICLLNLREGDGRNESLFKYILVLQGIGLDPEQIRTVLKNTNRFILSDPLPDDELETVLRDEAFEKPIFFRGKTFLHNVFGDFLIRKNHIIKIDDQLHIYQDSGLYTADTKIIESRMLSYVPTLSKYQRKEILAYLALQAPETVPSDKRYISFKNGVYDLSKGTFSAHGPEYIIPNQIPWNYNPAAFAYV